MSLVRHGTLCWVAAALLPTATASQGPPPPPRVLEYPNPTLREHSISVTCAGGSASLAWSYDGRNTVLREFTFGGHPVAGAQQDRLQHWISEIPGDLFIYIECNNRAATLSLLSAASAGSGITPRITLQYENGAFSEVMRLDMARK